MPAGATEPRHVVELVVAPASRRGPPRPPSEWRARHNSRDERAPRPEQRDVLKFGGSSVADPDKIKHVAQRLVEARARDVRVVATVSAMETPQTASSTSRARSRRSRTHASSTCCSRPASASRALVAMAVHDLGYEAVSFTGSQAGIITDPVHTKAKIREITPVRVLEALDRGRIVLVAGYQGFSRDTMDVTTLVGAPTRPPPWPRGGARRVVRDLLGRRGRVHRGPADRPEARKLDRVSYEEMLEMAASGARVLMLRAVEIARNQDAPIHARSTFSKRVGDLGRRHRGARAADRPGRHPFGRRGRVLAARRARPAGNGRGDLRRRRGGARERRHDPPERRPRRRRASLSCAQDDARDARARSCAGSHRPAPDRGDHGSRRSPRRCGNAVAPGVAARMFRTLADEDINSASSRRRRSRSRVRSRDPTSSGRVLSTRRSRSASSRLTRRHGQPERRPHPRLPARAEPRARGRGLGRPRPRRPPPAPLLVRRLDQPRRPEHERVRGHPSSLLDNDQIRSAVANRVVDELFANVDVQAEVENQLPTDYKGLSGAATRRPACARRRTRSSTGRSSSRSSKTSSGPRSRSRTRPLSRCSREAAPVSRPRRARWFSTSARSWSRPRTDRHRRPGREPFPPTPARS